jgi:hypothetical protein
MRVSFARVGVGDEHDVVVAGVKGTQALDQRSWPGYAERIHVGITSMARLS